MLVLGSMPGKASLLAQQYYAHPRNAFWPIMSALLTGTRDLARLPYRARVDALHANGIAVWDVLARCTRESESASGTRESSLDSDIDDSSIVPNDFADFFRTHTRIERVFFNGAKAEQSYRRFVAPPLETDGRREYQRLPSTSPAHAAMSFERKLAAWRAVVAAD